MKNTLYLAVGMPRAGSGWHYNLLHDLVVANGGADAREIRRRFGLQKILTEVNCNIGVFSTPRVLVAMVPVVFGNSYTIKAHAAPRELIKRLIEGEYVKATYIYRDPRDALLSAFEYGKRMREKGGCNAFSHLHSIKQAIDFMKDYVRISEEWLSCNKVLSIRYEDLLMKYQEETDRLLDFLGINKRKAEVSAVVEKYRPGGTDKRQKGLHFVVGKTRRFLEKMTPDEIMLCDEVFGEYLQRWGYE